MTGVMIRAGDREGGFGRINGARSEADKQLVYQSKETTLETIRGHAIRGDGWPTSPECCSSIHGEPLCR